MPTPYTLEDHGSVWLLRPSTQHFRLWLADHVDPGAQWFGGALAVEPRYVESLVEHINNDYPGEKN